MPRLARRIIPSFAYHLTHRGNNKQQLFFNQNDYRKYLYWFEEARQKYGMEVLAFCLMPNHVHFVAISSDAYSFAKAINAIHTKFALYYHSQHGTVGHVWQGRYYSCLLQGDHLIAAIRYVERNPVRAKLVYQPWDWTWSSAQAHVLNQQSIIYLKVADDLLGINQWREYIGVSDNEGDLKNIRTETNARRVWGSDNFIDQIKRDFGIDLKAKKVGRPKSVAVPNF